MHRLETTLGVTRARRHGIEQARGDWIFTIDGDALIHRTPWRWSRQAIAQKPDTRIFYPDEDVLLGDRHQQPYFRPDFDPVLIAAQPYVNRAIVFDRALACALGADLDRGAYRTADRETVRLFWHNGHVPGHVPEVIYHAASLRRRPPPFDDRELRRKPIDPPPIDVVRLGRDAADVTPAILARRPGGDRWIDLDQPDRPDRRAARRAASPHRARWSCCRGTARGS